jgi:hypothetical protein
MAGFLKRIIIAQIAIVLLILPSSAARIYDDSGVHYDWGDFSSLDEARTLYEDSKSPVAYDSTVTVKENTFATIALQATDPDGDALAFNIVSGPVYGSLVVNNDDKVVYAPDVNFTGSDSFTFKTNDGDFDSNTATVTLTIEPDNSTGFSHSFFGNVTIDGNPAPGYTTILAVGAGARSDTAENPVETQADGTYGSGGKNAGNLVVQGCIENGTPLTFYVDGVQAEVHDINAGGPWQSTYPFTTGGETNLDLRVTSPVPPDAVYIDAISMTISNSSFVFTKDMKLRGNPWIEARVTGGMFNIELSAVGVHRFSFDQEYRRDATFGIYENGNPVVPEKNIPFGSKVLDYQYFATGTRTFEILISVDEEPEIKDVRYVTIHTTPQ